MATPSLIYYHQFGFKKVGSNCEENTGENTKPRGLHGISYGVFDRGNIFTFILRRWEATAKKIGAKMQNRVSHMEYLMEVFGREKYFYIRRGFIKIFPKILHSLNQHPPQSIPISHEAEVPPYLL